jgi:hypothetical protein
VQRHPDWRYLKRVKDFQMIRMRLQVSLNGRDKKVQTKFETEMKLRDRERHSKTALTNNNEEK